mgnify:FL=1
MKEQIEKRPTLFKTIMGQFGLMTDKDLPIFNLTAVIEMAKEEGYPKSCGWLKRLITESELTPSEKADGNNLTHLVPTALELRAMAGILSKRLGLPILNAANALLSEAEKLEEGK